MRGSLKSWNSSYLSEADHSKGDIFKVTVDGFGFGEADTAVRAASGSGSGSGQSSIGKAMTTETLYKYQ